MALQAFESGSEGQEDIGLSREQAASLLGTEALAAVIPLRQTADERPGMAATMAFVRWTRDNEARGYGKFGVAEYKRDEAGLYVDHQGPKVYLRF